MKEHNKARLALIDARYGRTEEAASEPDFEAAFLRVRDEVIRPMMEEVASELRRFGHTPEISVEPLVHEEETISPCISLWPGYRGRSDFPGFVALGVSSSRKRKEVLAWLLVPPMPFDLERHAHPDEIHADYVEQCMVDAIEHLFSRASVRLLGKREGEHG